MGRPIKLLHYFGRIKSQHQIVKGVRQLVKDNVGLIILLAKFDEPSRIRDVYRPRHPGIPSLLTKPLLGRMVPHVT